MSNWRFGSASRVKRYALILCFAGVLAVGWPQRLPRPYSVQMHIHALSHHGNPWGGSMGAHSWFARTTGTDVVWWSEHHHIFHPQKYDFEIDFSGARVDPRTLDVLLAPEPGIAGSPAAEIVPRPAPGRPVLRYLTRLMARCTGGAASARPLPAGRSGCVTTRRTSHTAVSARSEGTASSGVPKKIARGRVARVSDRPLVDELSAVTPPPGPRRRAFASSG